MVDSDQNKLPATRTRNFL